VIGLEAVKLGLVSVVSGLDEPELGTPLVLVSIDCVLELEPVCAVLPGVVEADSEVLENSLVELEPGELEPLEVVSKVVELCLFGEELGPSVLNVVLSLAVVSGPLVLVDSWVVVFWLVPLVVTCSLVKLWLELDDSEVVSGGICELIELVCSETSEVDKVLAGWLLELSLALVDPIVVPVENSEVLVASG
jgi:hypothetical protein